MHSSKSPHSVPHYNDLCRGDASTRKERRCLKCGELFYSEGSWNRICRKHNPRARISNKYEQWAEGPAVGHDSLNNAP